MSNYNYQRKKFTSDLQHNALMQLIIIILVVFVLFAFINVFYLFTFKESIAEQKFIKEIYGNLALPANLNEFIRKPWTLITHFFYHYQAWHLIGNLLWLWVFGSILHDLTGNKKIIPVFIYGALGGAAAYLLAYNLVPSLREISGNAVGASAGIMAVVAAATMIAPDYRFFPMLNGGIPIWIITCIYLAIDLFFMTGSNTGGHIAHLGGGITGFLFIFFLRQGLDWSNSINNFFDWVNNLFNPDKPKRKTKEELFYKAGKRPYSKTPHLTQGRVDDILDKISQQGYSSLTEEEKELLRKASKEDL